MFIYQHFHLCFCLVFLFFFLKRKLNSVLHSFWSGKNQESWALDLELEDLKLLCPDGTEAGLDEYLRCHLSAVPANGVVVRMEDKCRVWKYLERLQVERNSCHY